VAGDLQRRRARQPASPQDAEDGVPGADAGSAASAGGAALPTRPASATPGENLGSPASDPRMTPTFVATVSKIPVNYDNVHEARVRWQSTELLGVQAAWWKTGACLSIRWLRVRVPSPSLNHCKR